VLNHASARDCKILDHYHRSQPIYQLIMPYGGERIDKYFQRRRDEKNPCSFREFLDIVASLFEGLIMMDNKKTCHQDIKSSNVLITREKRAIYIDYSLMLPYDQLYAKQNLHRLRYTYYPYPPEYKIVYLLLVGCNADCPFNNEVVQNIFKFGDARAKQYFTFVSEAEVYRNLNLLMRKMLSLKMTKHQLLEWIGRYANRVDVYGLGTCLVDLSRYVTVKEESRERWSHFVKGMIHPDVRKRFTPRQALHVFTILRNMVSG
jgi:serine/threonine protein kinase